ncbi:hypothetical protein CJO80_27085 (plasmid) [Ralstonia solanacearum]|nr:hypothetical protein CJO80_27085 [Ralstonia solanacearum]
MEYKIMWGTSQETTTALENLANAVNEQIQDGWEPQGGICSVVGHAEGQGTVTVLFSQAMIKR